MSRLHTNLSATDYLKQVHKVLQAVDTDALQRFADRLYHAYEQEQAIFILGNGGSGATASHFAEDLCHGTVSPSRRGDASFRRYRAMSLVDNVPWMLALANDIGYEHIFVEQLLSLANEDDVVVAISGSGNSSNVVNAARWGKEHGISILGVTGFDGGELKRRQDDGIHVPVNNMALAESAHGVLLHWVVDDLYARLNQEARQPVEAMKIG